MGAASMAPGGSARGAGDVAVVAVADDREGLCSAVCISKPVGGGGGGGRSDGGALGGGCECGGGEPSPWWFVWKIRGGGGDPGRGGGEGEGAGAGIGEEEDLALPACAVLRTTAGDITLRLFPEHAPKAVENFTTHGRNGYYDNLTFHRVIKGFMIQGLFFYYFVFL